VRIVFLGRQSMVAFVLIAVVALAALALWWRQDGMRRVSNAAGVRVRDRKHPTNSYHCVELRFPRDGCDAVKRVGTKRFLSAEAPGFPVPGCNAARCSCHYVHHDDRRQSDRRNPYAQQTRQPLTTTGEDRRITPDRRKPPKTQSRPSVER
jgi:hypothetical protein